MKFLLRLSDDILATMISGLLLAGYPVVVILEISIAYKIAKNPNNIYFFITYGSYLFTFILMRIHSKIRTSKIMNYFIYNQKEPNLISEIYREKNSQELNALSLFILSMFHFAFLMLPIFNILLMVIILYFDLFLNNITHKVSKMVNFKGDHPISINNIAIDPSHV